MDLRLTLLFLATLAICPAADDPQQLLRNTKETVVDTVGQLQRYVCTQTVARSRFEPDSFLQHSSKQSRPCDEIVAEVHGKIWKQRLVSSDRLRLDVAVTHDPAKGDGEMYSWVGAERFSDRDLFDLVPDGAMSTGSFSSMLASIFQGGAARFSYSGDIALDGKQLCEFAYEVPQEASLYSYVYGKDRRQVRIGYGGTILVDPQTADLMRLTVRTDPLPSESAACEITRAIDYGRVRLNGNEFLLPKEARITVIHADETVAENIITYSGCREFHGQSNLRFDAVAGPPSAEEPATGKLELPPGLRFAVTLTERIDPGTAAAGDTVRARLKTPIRNGSQVLVPEGTPVVARIVNVRLFHDRQQSSLVVSLKLESLEMNKVSYPLNADFDSGLRRFVKPGGGLSVRVEIVSADVSQSSDIGQFEFHGPDIGVQPGFESNWATANH